MAIEPKRHCPKPGHKAFFGRRCPKCEKERNDLRGSGAKRGYDAEWRKFRLRFIQKNPICNVDNCSEPVSDVHHIVSLANGGNRLDESNCLGLCHRHHSQITGRENVKHVKFG